ncbi:Uncharacterised protein [Salmonella enterica subsp. enterica]|nr:hypothetical protein SEETMRM10961_20805 [Salmonella enterica subsp. enterica serovar Typhimurium]SUG68720.1 Uncharacterised protein [Salmonella enterica subsp. enterica]
MTVLHSVDFFHQVKRPWRLNLVCRKPLSLNIIMIFMKS